jgi:DNA repair ATPase RecN
VACFASHHLRVEKEVKKLNKEDRTSADVKALTSESEKIQELARMLSGLGNDKTALANAAAMRTNALTQQHSSTDKKIKSSSTKARPREASL